MDSDSLAGNIMRVFEDDELACQLSKGALHLRALRKRNFGDEMLQLYSSVLSGK